MGKSAENVWQLPKTVKGKDIKLQKDTGVSSIWPSPSTGPTSSSDSPASSLPSTSAFPSGSYSASSHKSVSSAAKARLHRIVNKVPEAMVKVTGRTRDIAGHLQMQFDYITRNGRLPAVTQNGQRVTERLDLRTLHDEWLLANAADSHGKGSPDATQSVAIILAMPPGTPADKVETAARAWAHDTFKGTHDWLMARHDDTGHPHVHIVVRAVGRDGYRLAPGPHDLQEWRERFAHELRCLGLEAEATPRQARGAVRKKAPISLHKAEQRGLELHIQSAQQHEVERDAQRSEITPPRAWSRSVQERQESIRQAYLDQADILMTGDSADRKLARDIRRFVADMPVPITKQQMKAVELRQELGQDHAQRLPSATLPSVATDSRRLLTEISPDSKDLPLVVPSLPRGRG